ncbi:MAG: hypothetical protein DRN81_01635 [Thermoproteota archaeon]|nr:MAG: hypothetical protein DRN81_01635 [Candidatus Korarchaeota archaeon]
MEGKIRLSSYLEEMIRSYWDNPDLVKEVFVRNGIFCSDMLVDVDSEKISRELGVPKEKFEEFRKIASPLYIKELKRNLVELRKEYEVQIAWLKNQLTKAIKRQRTQRKSLPQQIVETADKLRNFLESVRIGLQTSEPEEMETLAEEWHSLLLQIKQGTVKLVDLLERYIKEGKIKPAIKEKLISEVDSLRLYSRVFSSVVDKESAVEFLVNEAQDPSSSILDLYVLSLDKIGLLIKTV